MCLASDSLTDTLREVSCVDLLHSVSLSLPPPVPPERVWTSYCTSVGVRPPSPRSYPFRKISFRKICHPRPTVPESHPFVNLPGPWFLRSDPICAPPGPLFLPTPISLTSTYPYHPRPPPLHLYVSTPGSTPSLSMSLPSVSITLPV